MRPMNVLVTAASRRVPLVRAFQRALHTLGIPGEVVVTDVDPSSPAVHVADRAYRVPLSSDPAYIDHLLAICEAERVGLVVPTIDDELPRVGAARERFAAVGALAACSSEATAAACNDKLETCELLRDAGVPAAATWRPADVPPDVRFPLFIKPRAGRGAVGAFHVATRRELEFFSDYVPDPVVQEYLDGPEFTVDVLCDFTARPLVVVPRERVVVRAGVIDRGRTVRSAALTNLALAACRVFGFTGPANIQCRMRGADPVIFEINPRFPGGIPLTIAAGADLPRMLLMLAQGQPVPQALDAWREGVWMSNYEASLFLEPGQLALAPYSGPPVRIAEVA